MQYTLYFTCPLLTCPCASTVLGQMREDDPNATPAKVAAIIALVNHPDEIERDKRLHARGLPLVDCSQHCFECGSILKCVDETALQAAHVRG